MENDTEFVISDFQLDSFALSGHKDGGRIFTMSILIYQSEK